MRKGIAVVATVALVAAGIAFTGRDATSRAAIDETDVVAIFDLANTADIETGRLAAERAENKEVRDYGIMLSQVHTEVRQKGRDLAKKLGVTPATISPDDPMAKDHAAVMKKLGALRGAEFDRAFLQHEAAFHGAVLTAVKTSLLPAIRNPELKDFVTSLAPAFEAHRLMAEHLTNKYYGK